MAAFTSQIAAYETKMGDHRAGAVDTNVLAAMEALAPSPLQWSMERGCGKTTILLSNLSASHHVFALDDRGEERSSIRYYTDCEYTRNDRISLISGPTQLTLPRFAFDTPIDLALLDGPHAYPFPEIEYHAVYPHLRPGALLVIDDIHIPTIHRLFRFLLEETMFELLEVVRTTAFFRRTDAPVFPPLGDGWDSQRYNKTRFPVDPAALSDQPPSAAASPPPPQPLAVAPGGADARVAALEARLAVSEEKVRLWQRVAEDRRLTRRLQRRLGPLGKLLGNG
jgi:hypothetical protein